MLACPSTTDELGRKRLLGDEEVQVWTLSEPIQQDLLREFKQFLSPDELERAARFRFPVDQERFAVSRGILRCLLAGYLASEPGSFHFEYSDKGKPYLSPALELQFNVAHSGAVVLWAFARGRRLGVDVEEIRSDVSTQDIAERFFSAAERQALRTLPTQRRHQAFFQCWTRKEAFVKATGDGLSLPLDQFDVTLAPGHPAQLVATRPDAKEARRWSMHNLHVHPNYAAALVVERSAASER